LAAVREAARGAYPVGDIASMLGEIEGGYGLWAHGPWLMADGRERIA
jgi:hypothetical protein